MIKSEPLEIINSRVRNIIIMQKAKVSVLVAEGSEDKNILTDPYAPMNHDNILRQWTKIKPRLILSIEIPNNIPIVERMHITNITNSWYVANECFGIKRYEVAIIFASISVEALLNHDDRMFSYRVSLPRKWIDLGVDSLKIAKEIGIDVSDLLEDKNGKSVSIFVDRRNKIAHGDMVGYSIMQKKHGKPEDTSEYDFIGIKEEEAIDQIMRSFNFIKKWGESKPTVVLVDMEEINLPSI